MNPGDESSAFLLISSSGPATDHQSEMFGLYRKTGELKEGRNVYVQESDLGFPTGPVNLSSAEGVWSVTRSDGTYLKAATPSHSPISVKWQFKDFHQTTWHDDLALRVTGLSEKPSFESEAEVTIRLTEDVKRDIKEPRVEGVYKANGSYYKGRPVLQHSDGHFKLFVAYFRWKVGSDVGGSGCLMSGSVPSQCPADPRAARNEREGRTQWQYWNSKKWTESSGISVSFIWFPHK